MSSSTPAPGLEGSPGCSTADLGTVAATTSKTLEIDAKSESKGNGSDHVVQNSATGSPRTTSRKDKKRAKETSASNRDVSFSDDGDSDSDGDSSSDSDSDYDSDNDHQSRSKLKSRKSKKKHAKVNKSKPHNGNDHKKSPAAKKRSNSGPGQDSPSDDTTSNSSDSDADRVAGATSKNSDAALDVSEQVESLRLQLSQIQQQLAQPNLNQNVPPMQGQFAIGQPGPPPNFYGNMGNPGGYSWNPSLGFESQNQMAAPKLLPPPPIQQSLPGGRLNGRGLMRAQSLNGTGKDGLAAESSNDPQGKGKSSFKKGTRMEYKRVDWIWDTAKFTFKLQDTAEVNLESEYDEYIFHIRRTFDCEGKYRATYVDIQSKLLRECLQDVIGNVKGLSLVDETPKIDPNMLFLYLEELRTHLKHLKKASPAGETKKERKRNQKRLDVKRQQLKVLIKYLDKDYAGVKASLYPMLENGLITFDLLWALWKPSTLAYTSTYGSPDEPRVFKVEQAEKHSNMMKGVYYFLDGKYFEFDGKRFGYGGVSEEIPEYRGVRKITSLPCYPLKYHKNEEQVRRELIERGKKFVSLSGVHYKSYAGMAYMKQKKNRIIKFNIQQSRIMVDPAIFRRINPNYYVSIVRSKDHDVVSDDGLSDDDSDPYIGADSSDNSESSEHGRRPQFVTKVFKNANGDVCMTHVLKTDADQQQAAETLETINAGDGADANVTATGEAPPTDEVQPSFSDDDYLIASPMVLGFAFSEKQWLEFSVSSITDIKWNESAWDSLVLEPATKDLIQALVKSRKFSAAETIDDVIQGKGKGLVTVLHGPPGTGKTLTAEGISELLKCPLYMASAGELGVNMRSLEVELQKMLDICHAWGAILLLDEADVFLEKRNMHDINRNALVSIFLRQLEYFQGILFLTTNRVETFDEAFQSRIHIALRYDALDVKAKKTIFKMFLDRVRALGRLELEPFTDEDLTSLAKHELNGREIKNVIGSAQDLAMNKGQPLGMKHVRQVLDVHTKFGRDLRGGTGYEDAMRSYF